MNLNNKIYKLRKEKNLSQEEFANIINVSRQSVSKWELGESTPEVNKIIEIAKLFNVSTDYLLIDKQDRDKKVQNNLLVNTIIFSIGFLLLIVSMITSMLIPVDITTNHSGIIAYLFEDWTLWGSVWRFLFFIPGITMIIYSIVTYLCTIKK